MILKKRYFYKISITGLNEQKMLWETPTLLERTSFIGMMPFKLTGYAKYLIKYNIVI